MPTKTHHLELMEETTVWLRDALVEEMMRTCKATREQLRDHLEGSNIDLANSRDSLRMLNGLADAMEQLDPPGWRETLPYHGPEAGS